MKVFVFFTSIFWMAFGNFLPVIAGNQTHLRQLKDTGSCQKCDLSGADLRGLDLSGADLRGANLMGANLCGAKNINSANLSSAKTNGAQCLFSSPEPSPEPTHIANPK